MTEFTGIIRSKQLGNERTVWVRPPRNAAARDMVVFLDAELYRERVSAASTVQEMSNAGDIADSWCVFVSMHSVEARWVECPCYPPFAKFIGEELLPWLIASFPHIVNADRRTLIGLSFTGLAAAYIAREVPGLFHRVISQSGSFWWNHCWLVNAYEKQPVALQTEFYLEVGSREVQQHVHHRDEVLQVVSQVEGVRQFRDVLLKRGLRVHYSEYDGGHEFQWWSKTLPKALRWALPIQGLEPTTTFIVSRKR